MAGKSGLIITDTLGKTAGEGWTRGPSLPPRHPLYRSETRVRECTEDMGHCNAPDRL